MTKVYPDKTLHVYRLYSEVPKDANTATARYVAAGTGLSGLRCRAAFIHFKPETKEEQAWIDDVLFCRMAPGAVITYLDSPSWEPSK